MKVLSARSALLFAALLLTVFAIGCYTTTHDAATDSAMVPCGSPYTTEPGTQPQLTDQPLPKIGFVLVMS